ncbi:hypothetical protein RUM43_014297 [Polyplax serrata]|uniref:Uncharacterized protein n=1 Tax=Polyplax serrata TaxID=468196 RepID=A0AAN8S3M5_POLSC
MDQPRNIVALTLRKFEKRKILKPVKYSVNSIPLRLSATEEQFYVLLSYIFSEDPASEEEVTAIINTRTVAITPPADAICGDPTADVSAWASFKSGANKSN